MIDHQKKLMELWDKRIDKGLDKKEWILFYKVVALTLSQCYGCKSLLSQCPEKAENYYASFFSDVIFIRAENRATAKKEAVSLNRPQSLCDWFKKYLISACCRTKTFEELDVNTTAPPPADITILNKAQKEKIKQSAKDFLKSQEAWVKIYLKLHFCADKCQSTTLRDLAARYKIAAYHYKAKQLGCIAKKKGVVDYAAYKKTYLGEWLSSLDINIEITNDNRGEITQIFEILCHQALTK